MSKKIWHPKFWNCVFQTLRSNLLGRMSKKAGLSTHFTSHCIRATSVTILKAAGLENSRVRSVTGRKSDASIESYNERPTIQQQVQSSAIVSNFVAAKANLANESLRVTAQSRSSLRAPQQNQSQDEICSINQQSNVANCKPTRPRTFHRVLFKTVLSIFMVSLLK